MQNPINLFAFILGIMFSIAPIAGWSHANCDHTEPRVGSTVEAPSVVRIWFDAEIEKELSKVSVKDSSGKVVDKGDSHVSTSDSKLLEVEVSDLTSGKYNVNWNVVARDGHHTEGDFSFRVR
jgi:copper resistance protein C